jgi:hypothetical protein
MRWAIAPRNSSKAALTSIASGLVLGVPDLVLIVVRHLMDSASLRPTFSCEEDAVGRRRGSPATHAHDSTPGGNT